jgi:negative regulator of sigma E activity
MSEMNFKRRLILSRFKVRFYNCFYRVIVTIALFSAIPLTVSNAQTQTTSCLESAHPISDLKAVQMLRRMIQAEKTRAYSAREVTLEPGRTTEETIKHDPRRGIRRESVYPLGEIIVDNYSQSWLLSTRSKTITESPSTAKRTQDGDAVKSLLKQKLPVEIVGEEKVAGRIADIVSVSFSVNGRLPLGQASKRFWIDRKTGLRLRSEIRGPGGRILASNYYLSMDLSPKFSPDDFTRPMAPADFRALSEDRQTFRNYEEATRAGTLVLRPVYLPTGFQLRTIEVTRKSGSTDGKPAVQRISQHFDNGISALTLVQTNGLALAKRSLNLADKNRDSRFFALPRGQRAYLWRDKDTKRTFALLGNLPDKELERIASSAK